MTHHEQSKDNHETTRFSTHSPGGRDRSPTQSSHRQQGKEQVALQREVDALARRKWQRRLWMVSGLVVVLVAGVFVGIAVTHTPPSAKANPPTATSGPPGPEGIPLEVGPLLAPAGTSSTGQPVDGVECNTNEQVAYHVHTHLAIYVNGQLRPVPAGIGIVTPLAQQTPDGSFDQASRCYYWLHVHAEDGVIHIESPAGKTYTLGDFFDLWHQPLSATQVGPATGSLTTFVNGLSYRGNPRTIELGSHEDIQIDVGSPIVPPHSVDWSASSL
jgi:hypothetical protein